MKKCVFCGGIGKIFTDEKNNPEWTTYQIECQNCKFILAGFDTKKEAQNEWDSMIHNADEREFLK